VTIGAIAGIAPCVIPASTWGWIQRSGPCAALTDGTLIVGRGISVASTAAGGVQVAITTTAKNAQEIGVCLNVAGSTSCSLVDLMLE